LLRATAAEVTCPLCGWTGREFEPAGRIPRPNARCPRCGSLERHRALFLYLRDETAIFTTPTRLLHFAPEPALTAVFERHANIDYVTTDIAGSHVSIRMDAEDLLFRDDVFDCVIISHVLEHVHDDRAAMRELARVARPGGFVLILVPILGTPDGRTLEDPSIVDPKERERVFGQHDHVRKYGEDFPKRVREAGFDVSDLPYATVLGPEVTRRHALFQRERLFVCRPASDGSEGGLPGSPRTR
jgi:SAM-dependent methyltransferase